MTRQSLSLVLITVASATLVACGGLSSPGSLISARQPVARAFSMEGAGIIPGRGYVFQCSEYYVAGDRGIYRATGCGRLSIYVCDEDVAGSEDMIECAKEGTPRALALRRRWREGRALEMHLGPQVRDVVLGRGRIDSMFGVTSVIEPVVVYQPPNLPEPQ